jgi:hypothetical protein
MNVDEKLLADLNRHSRIVLRSMAVQALLGLARIAEEGHSVEIEAPPPTIEPAFEHALELGLRDSARERSKAVSRLDEGVLSKRARPKIRTLRCTCGAKEVRVSAPGFGTDPLDRADKNLDPASSITFTAAETPVDELLHSVP